MHWHPSLGLAKRRQYFCPNLWAWSSTRRKSCLPIFSSITLFASVLTRGKSSGGRSDVFYSIRLYQSAGLSPIHGIDAGTIRKTCFHMLFDNSGNLHEWANLFHSHSAGELLAERTPYLWIPCNFWRSDETWTQSQGHWRRLDNCICLCTRIGIGKMVRFHPCKQKYLPKCILRI